MDERKPASSFSLSELQARSARWPRICNKKLGRKDLVVISLKLLVWLLQSCAGRGL